MSIANTLAFESNKQFKINFDIGDLSSDIDMVLANKVFGWLAVDNLLVHHLTAIILCYIADYFEDDDYIYVDFRNNEKSGVNTVNLHDRIILKPNFFNKKVAKIN